MPAKAKATRKPKTTVYATRAAMPERYRDVVRKIVKEEEGHQQLGERIVVELCKSGQFETLKQPAFERWLRLGMLSFGRPGSEGAKYAIEVGLKKRDPALVMQDFLDDI